MAATTEKRSKIVVLLSSIEMSELMIKIWTERSQQEYLDSNVTEQEKIIADAQARISKIRNDFESADDEIKQLKESIKYDRKCLIILENAKLIEKLKSMKGLLHEKDNIDKEAQG